jgi:hypothetical protein
MNKIIIIIIILFQCKRVQANKFIKYDEFSLSQLCDESDIGSSNSDNTDKNLKLFLNKYSFGENVKHFLLPLVRRHSMYQDFKFLVPSIPEMNIQLDMDCEVTVSGTSKKCKIIYYTFSPPYHNNQNLNDKNLMNFCQNNHIVLSDCAILNQTVLKKSKRWEDSQARVIAVPYSYVFRVEQTIQHLLRDLDCKSHMDWWKNTSIHTLLSGTSGNKVQFNYSACKFADILYNLPKQLGLNDTKKIATKEGKKTADTTKTFILSSTLTNELSTIINLGMNTYFLAKARDADYFPPTDFENTMLIYTVELMEAVLEVEGRQRDAAMVAALCRRILEDHDAASAHYLAAAKLHLPFPKDTLYRTARLDGMFFKYDSGLDNDDVSAHTVPFKLIHDAEQIDHLIGLNVFDDSWKIVSNEYMELAKQFTEKDTKEYALGLHRNEVNGKLKQTLRKIPRDKKHVLETYGRILHIRKTPAIFPKANALGNWDGKLITDMYINTSPSSIATIDNFLSPFALNEMFQFLTQSTIFLDAKGYYMTTGYLGAYMDLGMAPGLLFQIVSELRKKLPRILGDLKLTQAWAYKYVEDMDGINVHADDAAVNLNVWLTPDEANLNPADGGLYVYDKQPPDTWNFNEANEQATKIKQFLNEEPKAKKIGINYKQNRCVMFHSNLFHESGKLKFKKGFLNRRINLTLLFGGRFSHKGSQAKNIPSKLIKS